MASNSKIEWTDATWNPVRAKNRETGGVGHFCEKVSPGCANCYAERMQPRFQNHIRYNKADRDKVEIYLDEQVLMQPLRWQKPKMIFVGSMTDVCGDWVTDEMLDKLFAVMALCPQHTFQVLTKQVERLKEYMLRCSRNVRYWETQARDMGYTFKFRGIDGDEYSILPFPPKHVWLGVSCEDQATADERIPHLLATPAAVRFLSVEPMLGEIDFSAFLQWRCRSCGKSVGPAPFELGNQLNELRRICPACECGAFYIKPDGWPQLGGIIVGGESGPNARPMHPTWARSIRDQCNAAGVAFFFKQWGEWLPGEKTPDSGTCYRRCDNGETYVSSPRSTSERQNFGTHSDRHSGNLITLKIGKHKAGRLLDGREWNEMPEVK